MYLLILVDTHKVEPFIFVCAGLEEFHIALPEVPKHTLIANVTHAIEGELGSALLQQDWFDRHLVGFHVTPVVID